MPRYDKKPDDFQRLLPHEADAAAFRMIPPNVKILDLGCATGYHGGFLRRARNAIVHGVTLDRGEAKIAAGRLDRVEVADVSSHATWEKIRRNGPYDVVLALSILEHLEHPEIALQNYPSVISRRGCMIASAPNIRHFSVFVKRNLLGIRREAKGILDASHVRSFTIPGFLDFLRRHGQRIVEIDYGWHDVHLLPGKRVSIGGLFARMPLVGAALTHAYRECFRQIIAEQVVVRLRPAKTISNRGICYSS